MKVGSYLISFLSVSLALAACGGDIVMGVDASSQPGAASEAAGVTLTTFNAGFAYGTTPYVEERIPEVVNALRATDADAVCLQEVWLDDDVEAVRQGVQDIYPYSFRERTEGGVTEWFPCSIWGLLSLKSCMSNSCEGIPASDCVSEPCAEQYNSLDDSCKRCLAANANSPTSCAISRGWKYAHEGRNGLMLLSKTPLNDARFEPFETELVKRGIITATVADVKLQCTHLTSRLADVPYPPDAVYASWDEEQQAQLDFLGEERVQSGECTVLLGDLNASPALPGITPELPETLQKLGGMGYNNAPWTEPFCTWCSSDNPLASGGDDNLLDHILPKQCGRVKEYGRTLDEPVYIAPDGSTIETRLSDHYGVRAVIVP